LRAFANGLAGENIRYFHLQKSQKRFIGQRRRNAFSDRPPVGMRPDAQIVASEPGVGQHSPAIGQGQGIKVIGHYYDPRRARAAGGSERGSHPPPPSGTPPATPRRPRSPSQSRKAARRDSNVPKCVENRSPVPPSERRQSGTIPRRVPIPLRSA